MTAGVMDRLMAFDAPVRAPNAAGGATTGWAEQFRAFAAVVYQRGREAEQAGGLTVAARFKVRVLATANSRALTGAHSMRDPRSGQRFNIREVDALSDRRFVWLVVESGVAT